MRLLLTAGYRWKEKRGFGRPQVGGGWSPQSVSGTVQEMVGWRQDRTASMISEGLFSSRGPVQPGRSGPDAVETAALSGGRLAQARTAG
jgi:hypothetical protein